MNTFDNKQTHLKLIKLLFLRYEFKNNKKL